MKLIFIDRDGVVVRFPGIGKYVTCEDEFEILPNVAEGLKVLNDAGYEVIMISNQGCVAKGLITQKTLDELTERMRTNLAQKGGKIAQVFYCPHQTSDNCECKKPKTELFKQALRGRSVDIASLYMIGDSPADIGAGKTLGCKTILVLSGFTKEGDLATFTPKPDIVKKDLLEAALWLTRR
jgi:D-glycero-D-manno-heptose 1,7-bisphosphate phosphatase